jgi:hypothetical protein
MNKGAIKLSLITAGLIAAIAIAAATFTVTTTVEQNTFRDVKLLERGMNLPVIWVFLNTNKEFIGRSSRAIDLPFLNLCYQSIVVQNKTLYRVEVINGLSDLAERLGGWDALPTPLQDPLAAIGEAELAWIRAAILKKEGGMWLSASVVAIKPFETMSEKKVVFFGTDLAETYSGAAGTRSPGLRCLWSPRPEHPLFVKWESITRKRLETEGGGKEFGRHDVSDARELAAEFSDEIEYRPHEELARKPSGRRIQLEDLLAAGQQGVLPFDIQIKSTYVPIPFDELQKSRNYGWFLRMSEEQIMDSDLVITDIYKISIQ